MTLRRFCGRLLLACLACWLAALPAAALRGQEGVGDGPGAEGAAAGLPENRQRAIDALVGELKELTPVDVDSNQALKDLYQGAAAALVDTNAQAALDKLEAAAPRFADMPPPELLVSAMLFTGGNPAAGLGFLEKAALRYPGHPQVYVSFARVALSQQRRTDARVLLEKARSVASAGSWTPAQQRQFDEMLLDTESDVLLLDEKWDAARESLEKLLSVERLRDRTELRLAQLCFRQDRLEECLKHLAEYVRLTPESPIPELMLAGFFQQSGKQDQAGEWVEKALERNPENISVLTEYAAWKVTQEKFDQANEALGRIERLAGPTPRAVLLKGKIAFAQQAYELAESRFAELQKLEPNNPEIANLRTMALAECASAEKLALALETAQKNVQAQPQNPFAAAILGWVYFRQRNMEQAGLWFDRSARNSNLPPEAAYYFARFLKEAGQKDKALELIDTALQAPGLFLYRNAAIALRGELGAGNRTLVPPDGR